MSGTRSGLGRPATGDLNHGIFISAANSPGPSIGASSQITDGNSSFSGGRQLPSSSSINDESYMHLPASPMSSSNNISGSSVMDGSSIIQQSPQNEHIRKQAAMSHTYQSMLQDAGMLPVHKKPRLAGDSGEQQVMPQMLHRHQSIQLQALAQPQRLQMMQSMPHLQRMQMHQQPQMAMPGPLQLVSPVRPPFEGGLCARRLMQYMYHQSHRPAENSILYWRKFVVEYFAPRAKKRWCFSMYNSAGNHAFGAFPHASMDAWQCGICGSKTGKGFEATYEVIPRLDQIKFDHGVIDELLYLDMPHESRLPSGMMVLEYAKAVQESVHEQCRVVREGQLRIIFTPDLKILFWEFCARRHEELLPRRLLVNQVNQLLHAAHKYQSAVNEKIPSAVPAQDLQASCNMFMAAGRQLARNVEMPLLNDLGFPKRYVRCLQISEVVNCMKDLIDFSKVHKMGPIESLKHYTQHTSTKIQAQKMKPVEPTDAAQSILSDSNSLNKFMAMHPGLGRLPINSLPSSSLPNNSSPAIVPATNHHHLFRNPPNPPAHSPSQHSYASLVTPGRSPHHAPTKAQLPPPTNNAEHLPDMMNAKGTISGKACAKAEICAAKSNNDALKPAAVNNGFGASGDGYDTKQEGLDGLNIVDFDQDLLGELLNEIDW